MKEGEEKEAQPGRELRVETLKEARIFRAARRTQPIITPQSAVDAMLSELWIWRTGKTHVFDGLPEHMTLIFKEDGRMKEYPAQNIFTEGQEVIFLSNGVQFKKDINLLSGVKWNV